MPEWAQEDPRQYWRSADQHERANGRLFKEIEFALPRELSQEQSVVLARQFADHVTQSEHLPYTMAVHRGANPEELHCHLVVSERVNDGHSRMADTWFKRANSKDPAKGGAKKTTALMPKDWLTQTRADWQDMANTALERAGRAERIDHRSYKAQGLDRFPEPKLGPSVVNMERKGIRTHRGTEALQRASMEARRPYLEQQEKAFEHRRNTQGQEPARATGRPDPDRSRYVRTGREYVGPSPADRRTTGWFGKLVSRWRKSEPSRSEYGSRLEAARLETLGRYVDRGGRRVSAGPRLLEAWGRGLERAVDRFRNHESRAAVERHARQVLEADRRRQAESERAARLEKQRLAERRQAEMKQRFGKMTVDELKQEYAKHNRFEIMHHPSKDVRDEAQAAREAIKAVYVDRGIKPAKQSHSLDRGGPSMGR